MNLRVSLRLPEDDRKENPLHFSPLFNSCHFPPRLPDYDYDYRFAEYEYEYDYLLTKHEQDNKSAAQKYFFDPETSLVKSNQIFQRADPDLRKKFGILRRYRNRYR